MAQLIHDFTVATTILPGYVTYKINCWSLLRWRSSEHKSRYVIRTKTFSVSNNGSPFDSFFGPVLLYKQVGRHRGKTTLAIRGKSN